MSTATATRRADRRLATVAEIKAAAWADIRDSNSLDCSLRAVARRLGMAPSALYRYFASRDDLLTALIVDAFDDLTATLTSAHEQARCAPPSSDPGEVFVQVAAAYRRWAVQDPLRYRLVFGTPVGGYHGTEATTAASLRSTGVMLDLMVDLVAAGALDVERLAAGVAPAAVRGFERWSSVLPMPLPPVALAVAMDCYAALHGAIALEVNGHLPPPLVGEEEVYLGTMRRVIAAALR
ncbi:TetR/AcrR family transcriptional regulator [uncultured Friedmanniella sp.]|uniref:TetR/AcrR family transcriptional regulator n=1 Tax=uncultured Friedmanniella sp. TaxID=335381 RepID=UPI0035CA8B3D